MNKTLFFLILSLLTSACGDQRELPGVLQVQFESVPYDTTLDYLTDLAFTPDASGEFLAIGLYGNFEHVQLGAEGAVSLMSGSFDDVYVDFDAGQLGLAIDPGFTKNGYFYIATNLAKNQEIYSIHLLVSP